MLRLLTTNQTLLLNQSKPEEWLHIYTSGKTLKSVDDSFTVGRQIVDKYMLQFQRNNRWEWLMQFGKHSPEQYDFFNKFFAAQGIDSHEFAVCIYNWLMCTHHKKNTLFLYGPPNTGKTFLARLLTDVFMCGNMNLKGVTSDFYYEVLLNKSVAVMEELWVIPSVIDDFKSILSGASMDINQKHMPMQRLERLPVVITCNHSNLGRGFVSPIDEEALQNRCYKYRLNYNVTDMLNCHVSVSGFADWLLINYEKE